MVSQFNLGFGNPDTPCPQFTWAGTVDLVGETYGMAFIPTGAAQTGEAFHFEETWLVYETWDFGFTDGVLTTCDGDAVLTGSDSGVVSPNGKAHANGEVASATAPFDESLIGRQARWSGVVSNVVEFAGTFRVN